jgi:hypothetical protein
MLAVYVGACSSPFKLWALEVEEASEEAFWKAFHKATDDGNPHALPDDGEIMFVDGEYEDHIDVNLEKAKRENEEVLEC